MSDFENSHQEGTKTKILKFGMTIGFEKNVYIKKELPFSFVYWLGYVSDFENSYQVCPETKILKFGITIGHKTKVFAKWDFPFSIVYG